MLIAGLYHVRSASWAGFASTQHLTD